MDDLKSQAKVEKLKELRRILREIMAQDGADSEMSMDQVEDILEEAGDDAMEEPEGAMDEEMPVREATEEEMSEPEEVDELTQLKREYFKPKMPALKPGREGAKTVIVAAAGPKASMADKIPVPKRMGKGKMA
jgi:hypothetical protein